MSKLQATGVALFLWIIVIIQLTSHHVDKVGEFLAVITMLVAYAMITWEDKK